MFLEQRLWLFRNCASELHISNKSQRSSTSSTVFTLHEASTVRKLISSPGKQLYISIKSTTQQRDRNLRQPPKAVLNKESFTPEEQLTTKYQNGRYPNVVNVNYPSFVSFYWMWRKIHSDLISGICLAIEWWCTFLSLDTKQFWTPFSVCIYDW